MKTLRMKTLMAIACAVAVLWISCAAVLGVGTTVDLQNGLNGYSGQTCNVICKGWDAPGYSQYGAPVNYDTDLFVYPSYGNYESRTLLKFDLAGKLPQGATITRATLALTEIWTYGSTVETLRIYKALQPWTQGSTYWLNWGNGGYNNGYTGSQIGSAIDTYGIYELDTATVQGWFNTPAANYGMILAFNASSSGRHAEYGGRSYDVQGLRPMLSIEYN